MSEKKKEPKYYNEKTWKLDCRLALRQRACWVVCAAAAIGGGALIMRCFPQGTAHWVIIVWALLLMTGYQWVSRAPVRALSGWMGQRNAGETDRQAALSYVEALEKKLPGMKRKEMAFLLTNARGLLLFETGRQQEGIDLLRNFTDTWDDRQRQHLDKLIDRMEKEMSGQAAEGEEQP